jgi:hypothetical protein
MDPRKVFSIYHTLKRCTTYLCLPFVKNVEKSNKSANPNAQVIWKTLKNNEQGFYSIKWIVSRDWGGLLMGSVDRYLVLNVPATYLFLILMSSSYLKNSTYIRLAGMYGG